MSGRPQTGYGIGPALPAEAQALAELIQRTVRISNAQDYPAAVIAQVAEHFSAGRMLELMRTRRVFVARGPAGVLGTAALEGDVVRSLFVDPAQQGQGIGRALMAHIEAQARAEGVERLRLPASLTARGFYERLGYVFIREVVQGEERTFVMQKDLT